ncbi:hypothetical protein LguiA_006687 [Lonicera macranthoides]
MQVVTQHIAKEARNAFRNGNLVYSPSSIEVALAMVAHGSKGETLKQLLNFLGCKILEDLYFRSPSAKLKAIVSQNGGGGPLVRLANGVWVDKRFPIVPSYKEILKTFYHTEATSVDFLNKLDQVRRDVNSWAENETKGLIKEILPPNSLSPDTQLVLANALYFKAAWAQGFEFDPKLTREENFHLLNGDTVLVPFMIKKNRYYSYGSFPGYKILEMPYQQVGQSTSRFSMYFILADEKDGIKYLKEKFNADSACKIFDHGHLGLAEQELSKVMIPKFKFSYEFIASEAMKEVGLTRPFMAVKELTGIVDSPEGAEMHITKIMHKCVIEVDEVGTEAAAITLARFWACARHKPAVLPSFVADHPFMFMIREESSGNVVFVGVVVNPVHSN